MRRLVFVVAIILEFWLGILTSSAVDAQIPTPPIVNWGLGTLIRAWYQVIGGNTYAGQTIGPIAIPTPTPKALPYFTLDEQTGGGGAPGTNPGIVACGVTSGCRNFGGGLVSTMGWRVEKSPFAGPTYDYSYYQNKFKNSCTFTSVSSIQASEIRSSGVHCYTVTNPSGAGLDGTVNIASGAKSIVLVNGSLNVDNEVRVSSGGFILFAVSGDITFAANLGGNPPANLNNPTVQGMYLASGSLNVPSKGVPPDKQFVGKGVFVGYGGVQLLRNLGDDDNANHPAEVFVYDPALVRAAFPAIAGPSVLRTNILWQQVPP